MVIALWCVVMPKLWWVTLVIACVVVCGGAQVVVGNLGICVEELSEPNVKATPPPQAFPLTKNLSVKSKSKILSFEVILVIQVIFSNFSHMSLQPCCSFPTQQISKIWINYPLLLGKIRDH